MFFGRARVLGGHSAGAERKQVWKRDRREGQREGGREGGRVQKKTRCLGSGGFTRFTTAPSVFARRALQHAA